MTSHEELFPCATHFSNAQTQIAQSLTEYCIFGQLMKLLIKRKTNKMDLNQVSQATDSARHYHWVCEGDKRQQSTKLLIEKSFRGLKGTVKKM